MQRTTTTTESKESKEELWLPKDRRDALLKAFEKKPDGVYSHEKTKEPFRLYKDKGRYFLISMGETRTKQLDEKAKSALLGRGGEGQTKVVQYIGCDQGIENKSAVSLQPGDFAILKKTKSAHHHEIEMLKIFGNALSEVKELKSKFYSLQRCERGFLLRQYLEDHHGKLTESFVLNAIRSALEELKKIHEKQVVHGDISPNNIILNPITGKIKFIDLGMAHHLTKRDFDIRGTEGYMAPELKKQFDEHGIAPPTDKTDIYSLGMVLKDLLDAIDLNQRGKIYTYLKDLQSNMANERLIKRESVKNHLAKLNKEFPENTELKQTDHSFKDPISLISERQIALRKKYDKLKSSGQLPKHISDKKATSITSTDDNKDVKYDTTTQDNSLNDQYQNLFLLLKTFIGVGKKGEFLEKYEEKHDIQRYFPKFFRSLYLDRDHFDDIDKLKTFFDNMLKKTNDTSKFVIETINYLVNLYKNELDNWIKNHPNQKATDFIAHINNSSGHHYTRMLIALLKKIDDQFPDIAKGLYLNISEIRKLNENSFADYKFTDVNVKVTQKHH